MIMRHKKHLGELSSKMGNILLLQNKHLLLSEREYDAINSDSEGNVVESTENERSDSDKTTFDF
jgi:hypothetical protein